MPATNRYGDDMQINQDNSQFRDGARLILVVDDEKVNREILGAILTDAGYDVIFAINGQEALRQCRLYHSRLSLVLLDLMMPVLPGQETLRQMKNDPELKSIPVIVLTSYQDAEVESLTLGAEDFIPKPYPQPGVILARVLRTIELFEDREIIRRVTAEKERISTELKLAKQIQEGVLPGIFPAFPERREFELYASMDPAKEVGGDFYDFFLIDDDHLCLVIADVSGKGVPAALFMMISKILLKTRIQSGDTPRQALINVNKQLQEGGETDMFVTVWLSVLDLKTGKAIVSNAGHEHPVIRRAGSKYRLIKYKHSPALGMMEETAFEEHEFQMNPGDALFVYTDGVPEATNHDNELFGTDRMLEALNKEPEAGAKQVLTNVRDGVNSFVGDAEQFDDLTMLCLEYKGA